VKATTGNMAQATALIGNKVSIGNNCKIQNNVSVYDNVTLAHL
jgi:UDP-2-acetamido-3-amino-2,3-dideoxy-glucuronate N-acetyltransferase